MSLYRLLAVVLITLLASPALAAGTVIHFPLSSAVVPRAELGKIADLADSLKARPDRRVVLAGHADATGPAAFNVRLSHDRAKAVRDLLVDTYGVGKGQVAIAWFDSSKPVAGNDSERGRAANRRVEVLDSATAAAKLATGRAARQAPPKLTAAPKPAVAPSRPAPVSAGTATVVVPVFDSQGKLTSDGNAALADAAKTAGATGQIELVGLTGGADAAAWVQTRAMVDHVRSRLTFLHGLSSSRVRVNWLTRAKAPKDVPESARVFLKILK
ncbi:MAG: hypothetical protein Tsb0017_05390 [Geothermobacteraceae bacterium]